MKRLIESSNVYRRDNGWLLAEVQVKDEDVGFDQAGQLLSIKVAAYPFQKYGLIKGRIQSLAPDAQAPNSQKSNTLQGYKAIVACVFRKSQTIDPGIRDQLA